MAQADERVSAVVDFTDWAMRNACPVCGAEAYLFGSPGGMMRTRWRCDHATRWYCPECFDDHIDHFGLERVLCGACDVPMVKNA